MSTELSPKKDTALQPLQFGAFVEDVLKPYRDGSFLNAPESETLDNVAPLINGFLLVCKEVMVTYPDSLKIGGTMMEMYAGLLDKEEYWGNKKQLKRLYTQHQDEIDSIASSDNWRSVAISDGLKELAIGDPDIDFYVSHEDTLANIFYTMLDKRQNSTTTTTEIGGRMFKNKMDNKSTVVCYLGPISKTNHVTIFKLQLLSQEGKPLFHIDLTSDTILTGDEKAQNRRHEAGPMHDMVRGDVEILDTYESGAIAAKITYDTDKIPQSDDRIFLNLEKKDLAASYECVLREARKQLSHKNSQNFSMPDLAPVFDPSTIFAIKKQTSDSRYPTQSVLENQSPVQQRFQYKELMILAQLDPWEAVRLLQDTGLDKIFFGRHFSRREILRLFKSSYFSFSEDGENDVDHIEASHRAYKNLSVDSSQRNGSYRFICALGEVFSRYDKRDFPSHFKDGLNLMANPDQLPKQPEAKLPRDESHRKMIEALNEWGGLTETGLHQVLNQAYPDIFPNENEFDREKFRTTLIHLKRTGLVETAKRSVTIDGKNQEVRFYYPCINPTPIEGIQPNNGIISDEFTPTLISILAAQITTMEALMSFNESDWQRLQWEDLNIKKIEFSYVQELIVYLIKQQKEAEKSERIKLWINPDYDA